jgi:hypothetical protein
MYVLSFFEDLVCLGVKGKYLKLYSISKTWFFDLFFITFT